MPQRAPRGCLFGTARARGREGDGPAGAPGGRRAGGGLHGRAGNTALGEGLPDSLSSAGRGHDLTVRAEV